MKAEIIAVGTELLLGQIVNTNAAFLSQELAALGINVYHHVVVGDNAKRLEAVLEQAEKRSDLIILTGGLGPTKDDMTKQTVAAHLKKKLVIDQNALEKINVFHQASNRPMTENNRLQALVIEGSTVLANKTGLAAGMFLKKDTVNYLLLPGPPNELKPMFLNEAKPLLQKENPTESLMVSRVLRFYGIGESRLVTVLDDLIEEQTNPTLAPYAGDYEVTLRITANGDSQSCCKLLLDNLEEKIQLRVGEYFYGYGDTTRLAEVVVDLLKERKITITAAESLTGGGFQSMLASIPGASDIFNGGVVAYQNEIKEQLLGVSAKTLNEKGAVSKECANEMAEGVQKLMKTKMALSFTGVAGPAMLENQPVGTVWIALAQENQPTIAICHHFARDRNGNREQAILAGFDFIRRVVLSLPIEIES
ncbi:competence/damage-inducible protein A [Carnobacterium divergens]|uniref:competence/damage-inducible protein A n=1 Tax=Carnobacterium divergens TaxID=2748 RepID=UPI0010717274|nr:competence/damage-inducible protein A [Carnobacterium divergens]TFJ38952.1 competence/damage-inducible protein A [Carnobacterium divergens]TFJ48187.1 competence/damage-inducible protein A [Carnobacterium divergens]TFJ53151.1 competence/damage-inducible protein A [Carnobacterium divergens]TFJ57238.1 competence/damage-inducible protein A [Carnobacterium divergens]TFJ68941.1 competence/damage-inducible protein A [Carnobacterium divergens]